MGSVLVCHFKVSRQTPSSVSTISKTTKYSQNSVLKLFWILSFSVCEDVCYETGPSNQGVWQVAGAPKAVEGVGVSSALCSSVSNCAYFPILCVELSLLLGKKVLVVIALTCGNWGLFSEFMLLQLKLQKSFIPTIWIWPQRLCLSALAGDVSLLFIPSFVVVFGTSFGEQLSDTWLTVSNNCFLGYLWEWVLFQDINFKL